MGPWRQIALLPLQSRRPVGDLEDRSPASDRCRKHPTRLESLARADIHGKTPDQIPPDGKGTSAAAHSPESPGMERGAGSQEKRIGAAALALSAICRRGDLRAGADLSVRN